MTTHPGPFDQDVAFLTKGCVDVVTLADLRSKLARGRPLVVKVGFDPTAPDLHLGHTVLIRKMRHFQQAGHRVIFVIGDFTGMIGDPTGRSKTRPPLTRDQIEANAETYRQQVFKMLDPDRTEIRFNREWLGALDADAMIRLAARYNVARMLERRDFKQRYESGQAISVHEFLYPLAQAYDSVFLRADVELGGTDQLFNLNVGRDIMPDYSLESQVVLTTPLLEGLDGVEKMSKSMGNTIGVTEAPDAMFGKLLSISDDLMWKYYTLLTDLSPEAIDSERRAGRPMESKLRLAETLVSDFHGPAAGSAAREEWARVHQRRETPTSIPEFAVPAGEYGVHELLFNAGLVSSKSEAVRLLKQHAVKQDGAGIGPGARAVVSTQALIFQVGSSRFVRIRAAT